MGRLFAIAGIALLASMYIVPYMFMRDTKSWLLYAFWLLVSIVMLAISWRETDSWLKG
ncbi:MAG: hypothetical protein P3X22_002955 [Thermoprotei archaeon]|nr:hypothetical protein [Thermoprotei archaeon]